jgi:hypothetical protein
METRIMLRFFYFNRGFYSKKSVIPHYVALLDVFLGHERSSIPGSWTVSYQSFIFFAEKMAVKKQLAESIIDKSILKAVLPAMKMIRRSFLSTEAKEKYIEIIGERQPFACRHSSSFPNTRNSEFLMRDSRPE